MSRYSPNKSYGHNLSCVAHDCYVISWTVDRYYAGSRQRFPTRTRLTTGENGAKRFARKWGLNMPTEGRV